MFKSGNLKYTTYPPGAETAYTEDSETGIHMFTLSSLIATSLKNYFEKENKVRKDLDYENVSEKFLKEVREKDYDIYIIVGCTRSIPEYEAYYANSSATSLGGHWRNVLKFGDPVWAEKQK